MKRGLYFTALLALLLAWPHPASSEDVGDWLARGQQALKQRNYEQAAKDFRSALAVDKNQPQAWGLLGVALGAQGKHKQALAALSVAIARLPAKQPSLPVFLAKRGASCYKLGMYGQAVKDLQRAVKLKPDYLMAVQALGLAKEKLRTLGPGPSLPKSLAQIPSSLDEQTPATASSPLKRLKRGSFRQALPGNCAAGYDACVSFCKRMDDLGLRQSCLKDCRRGAQACAGK
jgi:tetratricopeptide (TPR) repeat protein